MGDVLVMTESILVPDWVMNHKVIEMEERLRQYIKAVSYYIIFSDFNDIIFVDWNNFDMSKLKFLEDLAENFWKNLELLSFSNDQEWIVEKWKGYGEQKILEYSLNNSLLIKNYESFYKVTWRYIVKNINKILLNEKKHKTCFLKWYYWWQSHCNTAFFKCSKTLFEKVLVWIVWEVDEKNGILLEHVYYDKLKKNWIKSKFKELPNLLLNFLNWWADRSIKNYIICKNNLKQIVIF